MSNENEDIDLLTPEGVAWIIASVIERAAETVAEHTDKSETDMYYSGLLEGYYEVLDIIRNRLIIRGQKLSDYGYDEIDIDSLEEELKRIIGRK